jgi:hypothetical protein
MGILTEVLAGIGEVGHGLATRRQLQGTPSRLCGLCGEPLTLVLLSVVVAASPIPQRLVRQGRVVMK